MGSPGMDSGPASPHSGIWPPQALPPTSATVTPLLAMGREVLLPKLTFPCSFQEESWVREHCIRSFRGLVRIVVGKEKKWMKNYVHSVLVPLILRMNDEAPKVGQVLMSKLSTDTDRGG